MNQPPAWRPTILQWAFLHHPLIFAAQACLVLACAGQPWIAHADDLRVGIAKVDITPTLPVTMSGYESRKELSRGIHDPLSARAVAFAAGGRRFVLISTEVLGFYDGSAEVLRQAIVTGCELQPAELLLAAIHTHSAPTVTFDTEKGHSNNLVYARALQSNLVVATRRALSDLAPKRLAFGSGSSPVGANRRQVTSDDAGKAKISLGRNPDVGTDREVQVLKLSPMKGEQPAAVLFAYATHSTSLGPGNYLISGDVHGLAAQFVERYQGGHMITAAFAGASGNIDPWYRVLPGFNTTNGWIPEPVLLGTLLGEEVVHVLDHMQQPVANTTVNALMRTLALPGKPKPDGSQPIIPFNVSVARVGPVAFVGLGGEVFNEIGKSIKAASPFPCTFVITHCNGAAGYLPTRDAYDTGGYEVQSSPFAAGAAELIPAAVTDMLKELRETRERD